MSGEEQKTGRMATVEQKPGGGSMIEGVTAGA